MFPGFMDPEMMRLAQEQMSRMRPEDLQKMQEQMMSNPDLLRMASEGMKNLRPEDLRMAAEQMKNIPTEQIADMTSRVASASPEELASMRAQAQAQRTYEYQASLSLKEQGNRLHGVGKFSEAAQKYIRAKTNLKGITTPEARTLLLTCSLNLMSCYLKTKQYEDVVAEGTEVLKRDMHNLKALYRRGQAYKELKKFKLAVSDLSSAAEISPDDDTIADHLRQAQEELEREGDSEELVADGPIIEEISEEEADRLSSRVRQNAVESSSKTSSVTDNGEQSSTGGYGMPPFPSDPLMGEGLSAMAENPEVIRSMHSMMSTMDPDHLAAMTGGGMTPEMAKMAANLVKNMSPDELGKMVGMATQFQSQDGLLRTRSNSSGISRQSSSSEVTSASSSLSASASASTPKLENLSGSRNMSQRFGQNSGEGMPSMSDFSPEMQEQMRNQMRDPAMKQMMASMVKSMTPETMVSMSEQLGVKLSQEEAAQAQKAMANLSPDDLDRIMRWADRAQRVVEQAKKVKRLFVGRSGLILGLVMLVVAIILHRFGYIG